MNEFFTSTWFRIGSETFTYGQILGALAFTAFCLILYWYLVNYLLRSYLSKKASRERARIILRRSAISITLLAIVTGIILILDLDRILIQTTHVRIRLSDVLSAMVIFIFARATDLLFSQIVVHRVYDRRDKLKQVAERSTPSRETAGKMAQWVVYLIAIILILTTFNIDSQLFNLPADTKGNVIPIRISNVLTAILVLLVARLVAWNVGSRYAFNQLLKYVLFTIAILMAIDQLGVKTTLVLGGLAALLVGVGLGLQQTFNDFFSGVILLFERSVELGDVLQVDGMIGSVKKIGMRASHIETRENITVVVPNSKLVTQNVINWSHYDDKVRFIIKIPSAYGGDPRLIKQILLDAAKENPYVLETPSPFVRLVDFGNSSVDFEFHFWSRHFIIIEDIKSDLRIRISDMFNEYNVRIPFPQLDVWMRSQDT